MTDQNTPHPWRTWAGWVLANTAGCILGFGLLDFVLRGMGWLSPTTPQMVNAIIYMLGAGLLGLCQWLPFGRHVSGWVTWTVATMLGFLVGHLGHQAMDQFLDRFLTSRLHVGELTAFVVLSALIGTAVGGSQWLLVRKSFPRAGWWIAANAAGWAGSALAFMLAQALLHSDLSLVSFAALLGSVSGMITGLCLVWLRQTPGSHSATRAMHASTGSA